MENVLEVNKIRRKILFFSYRLDDELWSGWPGFNSQKGHWILFFSMIPRTVLGSLQSLIQWREEIQYMYCVKTQKVWNLIFIRCNNAVQLKNTNSTLSVMHANGLEWKNE
jgi:hypothetical protein